MTGTKRLRIAALSAVMALCMTSGALAEACAPEVQSALDRQRESYIASASDFASQNFSRRPGNFSATTCLDNLMQSGGLDIFFKPPNLDSLMNMVKNLACEQASQIFDQLVGGSGINGGGINPAEMLRQATSGAGGSSFSPSQFISGGGSVDAGSLKGLFR